MVDVLKEVGVPSLTDKSVLITGGAGILGQVFARAFARAGAKVALLDVGPAKPAEVAQVIGAECAADVVGFECDIVDPASVDRAVSAAEAHFGDIDVLLNNAATKGKDVRAFFDPITEYRADVWREVMAVNVDGMFFVAQRVGRSMILSGRGGSIVQVGSIYGLVGPDERIYEGSSYLGGPINTPPVYAASKAAVVGLSKYLATSWAKHRIRVNCLVPGGVESGQNDHFQQLYASRVPMGRMAQAGEIAQGALFLASDASSYVTGQVLAVDGGWTAW